MKPQLCQYSKCTGCGSCVSSCSHNALKLVFNKEGFLHPIIDENKCVECHQCERKCPILNLDRLHYHNPQNIKTFTGWTADESLCKQSSSGGVFSQIAKDFLAINNSFVVGVEQVPYSNECKHVIIEEKDDLSRILGTKYIQSNASECYFKIKRLLKNGKRVLFCGTPCQVAALYIYLNGFYIKYLYTIELLCHGVTSKKAVDIICKVYKSQFISSYRNKTDGWCELVSEGRSPKSQRCTYESYDNSILKTHDTDLFYKTFGMFHRKSCYKCCFAHPERIADITLGDQWGAVDRYKDRLSLGASLIIVDSKKGLELLTSSQDICIHSESPFSINAYPYFMPAIPSVTNLSWMLGFLNHLPTNIIKRILSNSIRKCWLLFPYKILLKIGSKIHDNKRKKIINETREKYGWKQ